MTVCSDWTSQLRNDGGVHFQVIPIGFEPMTTSLEG